MLRPLIYTMIFMEMHEVFEQKQVSRGVDKIQAYTDTS